MAATSKAQARPGVPTRAVEVHPEAADAVFLSPRVVDQKAFDDFASRLRALLDEASRAGRALHDTTRVAREAGDAVGGMFQQQAERIGALQRLLKALEEHRASAAALVQSLEERERRAREAEASLEMRLSEVEEHIGSLVRNAEHRLASVSADAAQEREAASKRFGALEVRVSIVESLAERVHDLAARVERLMEERSNRSMSEDAEDLAGVDQDAAAALEEWSQLRREATAARAAVSAATLEATDTADRLDDAGARAEELLGRLDDASDELGRLLRKGDTLARLLERLTGPQELCAVGGGGACGAD